MDMEIFKEIQDWYDRERAIADEYLAKKNSMSFLLTTLNLRKGEGYWTTRRFI